MSSLEAQLEYAAAHLVAASITIQPDGMRALRWTAQLPTHWTPQEVELLVLVPPAYPAQAPSGFDIRGAATPNGAAPGGAGPRDVNGATHQHFCWNPQSAIDYTLIDGVWRFAQFTEQRFSLSS